MYRLVVAVVVVLGTVAVASVQDCTVDDLVVKIQQGPEKGVLGPCFENGYEIINAEKFNITFSEPQSYLADPYCIGFAMDTLSINVTLAYFYNNTNFIGSLNITSGIITYTIGEESVTYNPDETSGNKQLLYLLCADESKITLYNGCSVVEDVSNDHDFLVPGNISLQVLKDIKNPFKISQFYLLSCPGHASGTLHEEFKMLCMARSPMCTSEMNTPTPTPTTNTTVDNKANADVLCVAIMAVSLLCSLALLYG
jgi:hypothetical protein